MRSQVRCSFAKLLSNSSPKRLSTAPLQPTTFSAPPPRRFASTKTKRFYQDVSIASSCDSYEVLLDGKKLKTPEGNVLSVRSEGLAIALATEWDAQREFVVPSVMHLTALCQTANDNPNRKSEVDLAQDFLKYIETDTLCYRVEHPQEMCALQNKLWDPQLEWFCRTFDVSLAVTDSVVAPTVPEATLDKMTQHMISQPLACLFGYVFAVESLKSVVLAMAAVDGELGVEEAVRLSRLELEYQTRVWGNVEWHHDIEKFDLEARVAAAVLFVNLMRHSETKMFKR